MTRLFLFFCLTITSFVSFSQDVFDIGVRQIEIFLMNLIGMIH